MNNPFMVDSVQERVLIGKFDDGFFEKTLEHSDSNKIMGLAKERHGNTERKLNEEEPIQLRP